MEDIKLSKDLASRLKESYEVAKKENLNMVTLENVLYQVCNIYCSGSGDDESLKKFFSDMREQDRQTIYKTAEQIFETNKVTLQVPDKLKPDEETGITLSKLLKKVLTKAKDRKQAMSFVSEDETLEVTTDVFFLEIIDHPDCTLLNRTKVKVSDLEDAIRFNSFAEALSSGFGTLKEKTIETKDESTGLDEFLKSIGFKSEANKVDMKKDDEEFDKAGQSEAVSSKAVDPNSKTPFLDQFSVNMTKDAKAGKFDPMIGRQNELEQIIKILCCRKKNNVLAIGPGGVGKSAIVEGLSQRIVTNQVPLELQGKRICSLDLNALVSGTKYRGEYEERLQGIIKEVCDNKDIIVYIDEFHNLIGNGGASGSGDGANILKPYLARGEFQCIGSTTDDEYRKYIKDGALKRRFQIVRINEPTEEETVQILKGLAPKYEEYHKVKYPLATLKACAEWSGRYITERFFPDKAIDLMDTAGAQLKLEKVHDTTEIDEVKTEIEKIKKEKQDAVEAQDFELAAQKRDEQVKQQEKLESLLKAMEKSENNRKFWPEVTVNNVAYVISNLSGVPIDSIYHSDFNKLKSMKDELKSMVIGQDEAINEVCTSLQRNFLGFRDETKPIGRLCMLGVSGCGKTYLAEQIAIKLYGSKDALIKVNMGEYAGDSDINLSKLIGAGPGFIGYDDKPILEEVSEKRHCILLIDEVEKSSKKVFDIFLNILDKGECTLGNGKVVDFRDTMILFTGNLGTKELGKVGSGLGFNKATTKESQQKLNQETVMKAVKKTFRPEFINRLGGIIIFNNLGKDELKKIFVLELDKLKTRMKKRGYNLKVTNATRDMIIDKCDLTYGARDLQREIQKYVEEEVCNAMLLGDEESFKRITEANVDYKDGKVIVNFKYKKQSIHTTPSQQETKEEEVQNV